MARGFVYLAAVIDWFSRKVLSRRISITMDKAFCIEAVEEALARYGRPDIFNTDQGSQFTSVAFTALLLGNGIKISMDGKGGRYIDGFYNSRRPHSSLARRTPDQTYFNLPTPILAAA